MKTAYPVILKQTEEGFLVTVPDFNCNTQGSDVAEAMYMARDVIGMMGIDYEDDGKELPQPSDMHQYFNEEHTVLMVDIDFTEYRRKNDIKTVRRNVSLPSWLDYEATNAKINVSQVLKEALLEKLNMEDRL